MSDPVQIRLTGRDFTTMRVPARSWKTSVAGLVVTCSTIQEDRYVLTHVESGFSVCDSQFPSPEVASVFAKRIASLAPWDSNSDEIVQFITNTYGQAQFVEKLNEIASILHSEVADNPRNILYPDA